MAVGLAGSMVFCETFPSHDMARKAAESAAKEQAVPGETTGISYEDQDGALARRNIGR